MQTTLDVLTAHRPAMSCEQIAEALTAAGYPCSRQAVENWLSGRRSLSLAWYKRLSLLFAVPTEDMERGREALIAALEDLPVRVEAPEIAEGA